MSTAPKVAALRGGLVTLAAAADAYLSTPRTANPNTHHAYACRGHHASSLTVPAVPGRARPPSRVNAYREEFRRR